MAEANRKSPLILPGGDAQAKYWIDPAGQFKLVDIVGNTDHGTRARRRPRNHEEWARARHTDVEQLLEQGWIRVQFLPPLYLYVDFTKPTNNNQHDAIALLLFREGESITFGKIEVEIHHHDAATFSNNQAAFDYIKKYTADS